MNKLDKQIIDMYNEDNLSTYEIAKKLDTYPNKIRRTLKKHGVDLKDRSAAQKAALESGRSKHPTEGKERTLEERVKISRSLEKFWEEMAEGERTRRSDQAKALWASIPAEDKEMMRRKGIAAVRIAAKEGSKLEKFFHQRISEAGYGAEPHKMINPTENLEIDLYISSLKTIIEVDGPSHFLPIWGEDRLEKQINADMRKTGTLLNMGFVVIRVKTRGKESVAKREELVNNVLDILKRIEKKTPSRTNRLIEVE